MATTFYYFCVENFCFVFRGDARVRKFFTGSEDSKFLFVTARHVLNKTDTSADVILRVVGAIESIRGSTG